jgi:ABC-type antimicrobial peptide transport system permease subunit
VREVDATLPILDVSTQAAEIEERLSDERLFALAYTLFGGLATLLAAIGLFGHASYSVAQRTNEIGIRMALGADAGSVARTTLGQSLALVVVGLGIGMAAVALGGRVVASLLFDVAPTDPLTIAQAVVTLLSVAAVAGYLPARRAARVDPTIALQHE